MSLCSKHSEIRVPMLGGSFNEFCAAYGFVPGFPPGETVSGDAVADVPAPSEGSVEVWRQTAVTNLERIVKALVAIPWRTRSPREEELLGQAEQALLALGVALAKRSP